MRNWFLVVGIGGFMAAGCGSAPIGSGSDEGTAESSDALTAVAASGSKYRLNNASFGIYDPSGHRLATVKPDPNTQTASVTLKPGNYKVALDAGWVLQRQIDVGWVNVQASVISVPLGKFIINPGRATELPFLFSAGFNNGLSSETTVAQDAAPPGPGATGTALITIAADDCGLYVSKISSLAGFTIDCLGKVDPAQYSKAGNKLVRNFSSCTTGNPTALDSIDGVLSLQDDRPDLVADFPHAKRDIDVNKAFSAACIANEWARTTASITANVCPLWQLASVQNPPDTGVDAVIGAGLPPADDETTPAPASPALVQMQKAGQTYTLSFPPSSPTPNCGTAAQCAVACARGFKGFILSSDGVSQVTADPAYWELSDRYPAGTDPYLKAGYYHAMADYGPVPGDQFGHVARARQLNSDGVQQGEACTYYVDGTRFYTSLIVSQNSTGSVSWCKSPF